METEGNIDGLRRAYGRGEEGSDNESEKGRTWGGGKVPGGDAR